MIFATLHFGFLIVSSALTVGLLAPTARAQRGRAMTGGSMQSNRPSGTMGTTSTTRRTFSGGFGLNGYRSLLGAVSNYFGRYGATGAGQGGYGGSGSGYGGGGGGGGYGGGGGGGGQSQGGSSRPQSYGAGAGYDSIASSREAKSSQESAGASQLRTLRLFAGGLDWPRALNFFTSDGSLKELREGIDAQVERVLAQQYGRRVPADMLNQLKGDVDKLRKRFVAQSYDLPMTSQQEADARRFLGKLSSALEQLSTPAPLSTGP